MGDNDNAAVGVIIVPPSHGLDESGHPVVHVKPGLTVREAVEESAKLQVMRIETKSEMNSCPPPPRICAINDIIRCGKSDSLISVMVFNRMRMSIGRTSSSHAHVHRTRACSSHAHVHRTHLVSLLLAPDDVLHRRQVSKLLLGNPRLLPR